MPQCRVRLLVGPLVLIVVAAISPEITAGQGILILPDRRPADVVLERQSIHGSVEENVAVVTVEQVFLNPSSAPVEGIFLFPLPAEAHVTRFTMEVDGRELAGELLEADEARKIYEDIVRQSLDPALLEFVEMRTFRARLFPIPPGERRTIRLRYDAILPRDGETVTFSYPLRGSVHTRSVGGPLASTTLARPPAAEKLGNLTIDVSSARGIANVYSPSHEIHVDRPDDRHAAVTYEIDPLSGHDLIIYYSLLEAEVGATVLAHRPYDDRPGYFVMMLSPRIDGDRRAVRPRDIVFVLDTSGSMAGEKIRQAKDALRFCINRLGDDDRFGIVAFNSDVDAMRGELLAISSRDNALYFIDQLEAGGGTNIDEALASASTLLRTSDDGIIIFLTDGLPSVGVTDETEIRKRVRESLPEHARIYAFGVGYDVNTRLLDGIAGESAAVAEYISPDEDIERRVASFYEKIRYPVLTDLAFTLESVDAYAFAPNQLPDLHRGGQIIVAGRYRRPGGGRLRLEGRGDGGIERFEYSFNFPRVERERDFVARIWATRRVGQLLDEIRLKGENADLKEEIVKLAREFGLVTPYTSYLVQEEDLLTEHHAERRSGFAGSSQMLSPAVMADEIGESAVWVSKSIREMQEVEVVPEATRSRAKRVHGRALSLTLDSVWLEAGLSVDTQADLSLRFASDAYFELLRRYPEAAPFASIGRAVKFRLRGKVVSIGAEGREHLTQQELHALFE